MGIPKVGGANPRTMKPSEINRELDQIGRKMERVNTAMIDAGRGNETAMETLAKDGTDDDLTLSYQVLAGRKSDLLAEVKRRMGPGLHNRLPRGHARSDVQTMRAYDPEANRRTREGLSVTEHGTVPGVYPDLHSERRTVRFDEQKTRVR